jgi:chromosome segregation ATPase
MLDTLKEKIAVVRDHLASAERSANTATENAKIATGAVASAAKTLESALAAVASANLHAEAATQAAQQAQGNLESARAEFATLLERARG